MSGSEVRAVPKTSKGQATRARIVDAAAALVFERGVAGTSLDDVGAAAHVGKSQIYHYFADKSSLIGAVIARQTDAVLATPGPSPFLLDSWEAWSGWRDTLINAQLQNQCAGGCPIGSIANELADSDEEARSMLVDSFDQWERTFEDGIVAMGTRGLLRADEPKALAAAILSAVQGGLLLCKTRKNTSSLEASLDAALAYLRSFATNNDTQTESKSL